MDLDEALHDYRYKIVDKWVEYTLSTYEASSFFKKERDTFANPVGANTRKSLERLFAMLAKNEDSKKFVSPLEQIMNIRSIQEFSASQAVAPLHAVKHITRDVLSNDQETSGLTAELYDFEFAVDLMVLAAFDIYMRNRERLYQVRIAEIRSGNHILTDSKCPSALLNEEIEESLPKSGGH